jgi:hypothetical protein
MKRKSFWISERTQKTQNMHALLLKNVDSLTWIWIEYLFQFFENDKFIFPVINVVVFACNLFGRPKYLVLPQGIPTLY